MTASDKSTLASKLDTGSGGEGVITPAMDRRNRAVFFWSNLLIYFAAPVTYVGVVQAGLCDQLGASATVANLPNSAFLMGYLSPIILSWLVPKTLERSVVVVSYSVMAVSLAFVTVTLALPFGSTTRIVAVIGQGLVMGLCNSAANVYQFQCLKRGSTQEGIVQTFKITFALGPIAAVAGSLFAQWVLNGGIAWLEYPYDFAALYGIGVPCMGVIALLSRGYILQPAPEEPPVAFASYFRESLRDYFTTAVLAVSACAYILLTFGMEAISNLSLYTREAVGRDPKELSGIVMALRFGFKCVAGYLLGLLAQTYGVRAPMIGVLVSLLLAMVWIWIVPGYPFIFTFALLGAAELGGIYFPGYVLAVSPPETSARNLSLLTLASGTASLSPALHGALTDHFGFSASFGFGGFVAVVALLLTLALPPRAVNKN